VKQFLLSIYFILRVPLLFLVKLALPARMKKPEAIIRILVIRLDRIGDFVTSLALIKNLAVAFPGAKVDVLVRPYLADLARLDRHIDHVLVYEGFSRTARRLKANRYDIVIDPLFDYTVKTALFSLASGAPTRAGFAWGFREVLFTHAVSRAATRGKKMADVHLELLKALEIPVRFTIPDLEVPRHTSEGLLVVSVHPGGFYPAQHWPRDNFVAVIQSIIKKHKAVVRVIACAHEKDLADYIVTQVNSPSAEAVFPGTTAELVSVLAASDVVLCNNSGPLHIAAALGVPTVSTMGPTDPVLWQPAGEKNIVIRKDLTCSPCSKAVCSHHRCLASITPEDVFQAVEDAITRFVKKAV
jgi:heptosyltransferase-2